MKTHVITACKNKNKKNSSDPTYSMHYNGIIVQYHIVSWKYHNNNIATINFHQEEATHNSHSIIIMSPHNNNLHKRNIDCIRSSSNNDSSSIENGHNSNNEKWNNNENMKNKIQKLNNLNFNHALTSYSTTQTNTKSPSLKNIGWISSSLSSPSLLSSIVSVQSLISSSSSSGKTNTNNTKAATVAAHGHCIATTFPRHASAPTLSMAIPVLSPCTYMTISLKNKKIKPRIDSFSIEQALFFEPYQESTIKMELLQALRSSNLDQLKSYQQIKSVEQQTTTTTATFVCCSRPKRAWTLLQQKQATTTTQCNRWNERTCWSYWYWCWCRCEWM